MSDDKNELWAERKASIERDISSVKQRQIKRERSAFEIDLKNILRVIESMGEGNFSVWHCCTPLGDGYYTITRTTETSGANSSLQKQFCKSEYKLHKTGACWSNMVWFECYEAQRLLTSYLVKLRKRLPDNVHMEIRQLYLNVLSIDPCDDDPPDYVKCKEIEQLRAMQTEYVGKFAESIKLLNETNWLTYYNHKDNDEYYFVEQKIQETMYAIDCYESRLRKCGMWDKAKAKVEILQHLCYETWEYEYFRDYENKKK